MDRGIKEERITEEATKRGDNIGAENNNEVGGGVEGGIYLGPRGHVCAKVRIH